MKAIAKNPEVEAYRLSESNIHAVGRWSGAYASTIRRNGTHELVLVRDDKNGDNCGEFEAQIGDWIVRDSDRFTAESDEAFRMGCNIHADQLPDPPADSDERSALYARLPSLQTLAEFIAAWYVAAEIYSTEDWDSAAEEDKADAIEDALALTAEGLDIDVPKCLRAFIKAKETFQSIYGNRSSWEDVDLYVRAHLLMSEMYRKIEYGEEDLFTKPERAAEKA